MQQRLQRKKAWRRKINFFTGKRSVIVLHHHQYHHNNGQNNQSRVKNLWNRLFRRLGKVGKRSTTRKPSTFNQTSLSSWQKGGSLSSWQKGGNLSSSEKMNQPNLKSYEALFIPCWQRWLYNSALNQSNLWRSKSYRGSLLYLELQLKDNYQTVQVFCGPAYHE